MEEATPQRSGKKGMMAAVVFLFGALGWGVWMNWPVGEEVEIAALDSTPTPKPAEPPQPAAVPAPVKPVTLDEVRRAGDGITIIAGQAEPGADVQILKDGAEIATAKADDAGQFAAIATVPADGQGHVLTLSQEVDGTIILSKEEILLAPLAPPIPPEPAQVEVPVVAALEQAQRGAARVASTIPQVAEIAQAAPPPEPAAPQPQNVTQPAPAQPAQSQAVSTRPTAQGGAGQTPRPAPPDKVAILRATAEGVQLVEPIAPAPQAMKNIVLDTISYSDQGDVELAGRAQGQTAEVRVYLNNRSITNLSVDAAGNWRGALPDVDEGIYTLRVDEVTAAGTVSSRVETPFKREAPAVLAAASAGEGPLKAITVQAGATLWAIARDRYGDGTLYLRVFEANASAIRDPDLIYPGQVFDLPE